MLKAQCKKISLLGKNKMHTITAGGWRGHFLRRMIHIAMFFVPPIYYLILDNSLLRPQLIVIILAACVVLIDFLRIWRGWLFFGQRQRERHYLSSFAQGAVALTVVLLFVPGGYTAGLQYAWPLIAVLALVDPLLGELRKFNISPKVVFFIGWFAATLLWLSAFLYFLIPLWAVLVLPVVAVLAEWPNFKYLDDNAAMLLVPLLVLLVIA
jgi:hypothetical protein